jgi:hypothetical protein
VIEQVKELNGQIELASLSERNVFQCAQIDVDKARRAQSIPS